MKKEENKGGDLGARKHSAKDFLNKTKDRIVGAIDQNDDGRLNFRDISSLSERLSEKKELAKREAEYAQLRPLFVDDLDSPDFMMPKMIRVIEMDKKHAESELCMGSIGHESTHKELNVVNIYPEYLSYFGLSLYPDAYSDVYYVDPCDRDQYIALDDYFNYLKVARVSELQRVAQDLGAKHFRVTYRERSLSSSSKFSAVKANLTGGKSGVNASVSADQEHTSNEKKKESVEIAAEMECIGHAPIRPKLVYFKNDPQIQSLISLRMADNGVKHQVYTLELSRSSGIRTSDAVKIDAALSAMKTNAGAGVETSIVSQAQLESRRYFEYEIDF